MVNNSIQWFPGHMHKAQKEIAEAIPQIDVIIEVLDARIPLVAKTLLFLKSAVKNPSLKY